MLQNSNNTEWEYFNSLRRGQVFIPLKVGRGQKPQTLPFGMSKGWGVVEKKGSRVSSFKQQNI